MFIHTHYRPSSAHKRFAKFGWQTRTFCHKKWNKRLPSLSQADPIVHVVVPRLWIWLLVVYFVINIWLVLWYGPDSINKMDNKDSLAKKKRYKTKFSCVARP